ASVAQAEDRDTRMQSVDLRLRTGREGPAVFARLLRIAARVMSNYVRVDVADEIVGTEEIVGEVPGQIAELDEAKLAQREQQAHRLSVFLVIVPPQFRIGAGRSVRFTGARQRLGDELATRANRQNIGALDRNAVA